MKNIAQRKVNDEEKDVSSFSNANCISQLCTGEFYNTLLYRSLLPRIHSILNKRYENVKISNYLILKLVFLSVFMVILSVFFKKSYEEKNMMSRFLHLTDYFLFLLCQEIGESHPNL